MNQSLINICAVVKRCMHRFNLSIKLMTLFTLMTNLACQKFQSASLPSKQLNETCVLQKSDESQRNYKIDLDNDGRRDSLRSFNMVQSLSIFNSISSMENQTLIYDSGTLSSLIQLFTLDDTSVAYYDSSRRPVISFFQRDRGLLVAMTVNNDQFQYLWSKSFSDLIGENISLSAILDHRNLQKNLVLLSEELEIRLDEEGNILSQSNGETGLFSNFKFCTEITTFEFVDDGGFAGIGGDDSANDDSGDDATGDDGGDASGTPGDDSGDDSTGDDGADASGSPGNDDGSDNSSSSDNNSGNGDNSSGNSDNSASDDSGDGATGDDGADASGTPGDDIGDDSGDGATGDDGHDMSGTPGNDDGSDNSSDDESSGSDGWQGDDDGDGTDGGPGCPQGTSGNPCRVSLSINTVFRSSDAGNGANGVYKSLGNGNYCHYESCDDVKEDGFATCSSHLPGISGEFDTSGNVGACIVNVDVPPEPVLDLPEANSCYRVNQYYYFTSGSSSCLFRNNAECSEICGSCNDSYSAQIPSRYKQTQLCRPNTCRSGTTINWSQGGSQCSAVVQAQAGYVGDTKTIRDGDGDTTGFADIRCVDNGSSGGRWEVKLSTCKGAVSVPTPAANSCYMSGSNYYFVNSNKTSSCRFRNAQECSAICGSCGSRFSNLDSKFTNSSLCRNNTCDETRVSWTGANGRECNANLPRANYVGESKSAEDRFGNNQGYMGFVCEDNGSTGGRWKQISGTCNFNGPSINNFGNMCWISGSFSSRTSRGWSGCSCEQKHCSAGSSVCTCTVPPLRDVVPL